MRGLPALVDGGFVSFTKLILIPPKIQRIPLRKIPFTPISSPSVTKNGAIILPKLDIASETPVPVDLIELGKLYVVIKENKAKPKLFNKRLKPIKIS